MKRKLDMEDVPTAIVAPTASKPSDAEASFGTLDLDHRLLQAIAKEGFSKPTPVQVKAIPLALEGRDILARARTGSGKTAAYVLPIIESILRQKKESTNVRKIAALVLVPTQELAAQVSNAFASFASFCAKDVRVVNLTRKVSEDVQRSLLADMPDVVVTTPKGASGNLDKSALFIGDLKHLVIDEADRVLSYDYENDMQVIAQAIPKGVQTVLMSATLTTEVDTLKLQFCKDPAILDLPDTDSGGAGLIQYITECAEDQKFLFAYVIFKLRLIKGKSIVFVGDIDRCYRLKLFLEQFGVKSCVLNSELPVNSRLHVIEQFNQKFYDIMIATDEHEILGDGRQRRFKQASSNKQPQDTNKQGENPTAGTDGEPPNPRKKRRKSQTSDKEYGVSRGIDFKNVSYVLNFDLPTSSKSYTHRIGRTARAGQSGTVLSFVILASEHRKNKATSIPGTAHDAEVLAAIKVEQAKRGNELKPYVFDMEQLDGFRYRMDDALRAVTKVAIREARTRELRQELLKSEKLKRHFEENPEDLRNLRHDGELRAARVQPHLKHVPGYLMPGGDRGLRGLEIGRVALRRGTENRIRKARMAKGMKGRGKRDPLKTFRTRVK